MFCLKIQRFRRRNLELLLSKQKSLTEIGQDSFRRRSYILIIDSPIKKKNSDLRVEKNSEQFVFHLIFGVELSK